MTSPPACHDVVLRIGLPFDAACCPSVCSAVASAEIITAEESPSSTTAPLGSSVAVIAAVSSSVSSSERALRCLDAEPSPPPPPPPHRNGDVNSAFIFDGRGCPGVVALSASRASVRATCALDVCLLDGKGGGGGAGVVAAAVAVGAGGRRVRPRRSDEAASKSR